MRMLGCTKVQIGVQHTDNAVLELNKGEMHRRFIRAIRLMKDAGLKLHSSYAKLTWKYAGNGCPNDTRFFL